MQYVRSVDNVMPKKIRNCFYSNLTFKKMLEAHQRARKNKAYKNEVILFEMNLENNIINLINNIKLGKYRIGEYRSFKVYEPKERTIQALPYIDRVVQQWYVEEFIKPYIVPKFISTSFACLTNKGTHKAVEKVEQYMRIYKRNNNHFWVLKCDISKYFYTINPHILFKILQKYIADKKLIEFTKLLIFDKSDNIGIPIGNYTSQFFANIYLNELDYFVKRTLKIKYYVRYMDDFILLLPTKKACKETLQKIEVFLHSTLQLTLNNKSRYYPYSMGVNFCGYRIFTTHRLLRLRSKKKIKQNVKYWNKKYANNTLNIKNTLQSLNSWLGHSSHCSSYQLQNKILNSCNFLLTDHFYSEQEKELINYIEKNTPKH